jgi:hypothetical protein
MAPPYDSFSRPAEWSIRRRVHGRGEHLARDPRSRGTASRPTRAPVPPPRVALDRRLTSPCRTCPSTPPDSVISANGKMPNWRRSGYGVSMDRAADRVRSRDGFPGPPRFGPAAGAHPCGPAREHRGGDYPWSRRDTSVSIRMRRITALNYSRPADGRVEAEEARRVVAQDVAFPIGRQKLRSDDRLDSRLNPIGKSD